MAAALVPELYVRDLPTSLAFYRRFGFVVQYERPAERFAFLDRDGAEIMLEEPRGRTFLAGTLMQPYGVGINLQISVDDVLELHRIALAVGAPILLPPEERRYQRRDDEIWVRQCVVSDPDGYLLRFSQALAGEPQAARASSAARRTS